MAKKVPHEEHINHERYMVTYADLITLLLAFFIILYAMSETDEQKFDEVAYSLSMGFNQGSKALISTNIDSNPELKSKQNQENLEMMESVKEQSELRELKKKIDEKIKEENLEDKISTELQKQGLMIILTDEVLFNSGSAQIKKEHSKVIDTVGQLITDVNNPVQISGFTDNVPINTAEFPSNWELSGERSMSVLKYLLNNNKKLDPKRFSAAGYGEYQPIASNETKEGKAKNRRVEILIERINTEGLLEVK